MNIKKFTFNPVQENTYVLYDESKECIIIDAGCFSKDEFTELDRFIKQESLKPVLLVNTHGHFDHILGINTCRKAYNVDWWMGEEDYFLVENAPGQAAMFGMIIDPVLKPDKFLMEKDAIHFGLTRLQLIHVPGHSPGSLCLYNEKSGDLITGDVLFRGSIGRSDLPGGNHSVLVNGIKMKLLCLPENVSIHPGHGPSSLIGEEKRINPYLA